MRRPRFLVVALISAQLLLPAAALAIRLLDGPAVSPFGWQMFSTSR